MLRVFLLLLLAVFLIIVGVWPAAATPVALMGAGLGTLAGLIPGPVLLLAALVVWELRHRPTSKTTTA